MTLFEQPIHLKKSAVGWQIFYPRRRHVCHTAFQCWVCLLCPGKDKAFIVMLTPATPAPPETALATMSRSWYSSWLEHQNNLTTNCPLSNKNTSPTRAQSGSRISLWAGEAGMSRWDALHSRGAAAVGGCYGRTAGVGEDGEKGMKLM